MYNWSLKELYNDFDEVFVKDLESLNTDLDTLAELANKLSDAKSLENWITFNQKLSGKAVNIGAFITFRISTNSNDELANKYMGQYYNTLSKAARPEAQFTKWVKSIEDSLATWLDASPLIKEHQYMLEQTILTAKHTLSEDAEEILSKMSINGSSLWSQLQSQLTSNTTIEYEGKPHTLTQLRNLAYDSDTKVRKAAYEKELELYKLMDDSVAFALNGIKGEVIQTNKLRNYSNPLEETLIDSRLSKETLDALIEAIEINLPTFRKYLHAKAKNLGYTNGLPFYDLFAPYELEESKEYSVEDSHKMIVDNFKAFSDDLANMADRAYKEDWIDFLPKDGKRGGAYCYNLPHIKQSRIFTNYGKTLSDIITMAHELGHAYHGMMLEDNSLLNTDYSMPVAETASTFCENIIFNASMESATDEEKIMLIESSLQDLTQITVDILSRYKFETEVFERRQNEFLNSDTLQDIMLTAQKETYGDGLDSEYLHPYMWLNKGHYYSAGRNFYNFPYAFGGLFALGLYDQFEKEGESFVEKYRQLLKLTATASCEDVALSAGIDTTTVAFWQQSIDQIAKRIDLYIELTSK
ncbi:MAG: M3 family oligoendopeptidase [Erysipelothrix sp.]|nr:M3 family oligoendopeptidase [Erysipelothrix sp.]